MEACSINTPPIRRWTEGSLNQKIGNRSMNQMNDNVTANYFQNTILADDKSQKGQVTIAHSGIQIIH